MPEDFAELDALALGDDPVNLDPPLEPKKEVYEVTSPNGTVYEVDHQPTAEEMAQMAALEASQAPKRPVAPKVGPAAPAVAPQAPGVGPVGSYDPSTALAARESKGVGKLLFSNRAKGDSYNPALTADLQSVVGSLGLSMEVGYGKTGHRKLTTSGNISRHGNGTAVDVNVINGVSYNSNPKEFTRLANIIKDHLVAQGYATSESGNDRAVLFGFDDPKRGGNHLNHLHISNRMKSGPPAPSKAPAARPSVPIAGQSGGIVPFSTYLQRVQGDGQPKSNATPPAPDQIGNVMGEMRSLEKDLVAGKADIDASAAALKETQDHLALLGEKLNRNDRVAVAAYNAKVAKFNERKKGAIKRAEEVGKKFARYRKLGASLAAIDAPTQEDHTKALTGDFEAKRNVIAKMNAQNGVFNNIPNATGNILMDDLALRNASRSDFDINTDAFVALPFDVGEMNRARLNKNNLVVTKNGGHITYGTATKLLKKQFGTTDIKEIFARFRDSGTMQPEGPQLDSYTKTLAAVAPEGGFIDAVAYPSRALAAAPNMIQEGVAQAAFGMKPGEITKAIAEDRANGGGKMSTQIGDIASAIGVLGSYFIPGVGQAMAVSQIAEFAKLTSEVGFSKALDQTSDAVVESLNVTEKGLTPAERLTRGVNVAAAILGGLIIKGNVSRLGLRGALRAAMPTIGIAEADAWIAGLAKRMNKAGTASAVEMPKLAADPSNLAKSEAEFTASQFANAEDVGIEFRPKHVDPSVAVENSAYAEMLRHTANPTEVDFVAADAILKEVGAPAAHEKTDAGRTIADVRADIAALEAEMRKSRGTGNKNRERGAGDIGKDDIKRAVQYGALYLELGIRETGALAARLAAHFGEEIAPYVDGIIAQAKELHSEKRRLSVEDAAKAANEFETKPIEPGSAEAKMEAADRHADGDGDVDVDEADMVDMEADEEGSRLGAFQHAAMDETDVAAPTRSKETASEWADEAHAKGYDQPAEAHRIAREYLDGKKERLSPSETIGLGAATRTINDALKALAAKADIGEASMVEAERAALLREQLTDIVTTGYHTGSEWGREGIARQMAFDIDESAGGLILRRMKAAGRELTAGETTAAWQDSVTIAKAIEALAAREEALATRIRSGGHESTAAELEMIAKDQLRIQRNAGNAALRKLLKNAKYKYGEEEVALVEKIIKDFRKSSGKERKRRRKSIETKAEIAARRDAAIETQKEAAKEFREAGSVAGASVAGVNPAQVKAALKWARATVEIGVYSAPELIERLVKQFGEVIRPHAKEIAEKALSDTKLEESKLFDFERDPDRMEALRDIADDVIQVARINVRTGGYDGDMEALLDRLVEKIDPGEDVGSITREEMRAIIDGRIKSPRAASKGPTTDWQLVKQDAKLKLDAEKASVKAAIASSTAEVQRLEQALKDAKTPVEKEITRIALDEARAAAHDWRKHAAYMDKETKEFWLDMEKSEKDWKSDRAKENRAENKQYRDMWKMTKEAELEMLENQRKRLADRIHIMETDGIVPGQKGRRSLPHDNDPEVVRAKNVLKDMQSKERKLASEIKKKQAAAKTKESVMHDIQEKLDKVRAEIDRLKMTGQLKEVTRLQELYANDPDVRRLRIALLSARRNAARAAAKLKVEAEPMGLGTKALVRTKQMVATGDLSYPFNQGAAMLWMDQNAWLQGLKATFTGMSEAGYDNVMATIANHPDYDLANAAGLFEGEGVALQEVFGAGLEDAPAWSRPFEQSYVAAGEAMRFKAFEDWKAMIEETQHGEPLSIDQAKQLASGIKTLLGQGELGKGAHKNLTRFFFAYRYTLSQFEILGMAPWVRSGRALGWGDPVTKTFLRKYLRMYGSIATTMAMTGAVLDKVSPKDDKGRQIYRVERNPLAANFGRLVIRDKDMVRTVDIMPPATRVLVMALQFGSGMGESVIGNKQGGFNFQKALLGNYVMWKTSPLVSTSLQAILAQQTKTKEMFGKTYDINKPGATAYSLGTAVLPLSIQSLLEEAFKKADTESEIPYRIIWGALPIMFRADGFDSSALAPLSDKARAVLLTVDFDVNGPEKGPEETDKEHKERMAQWASLFSQLVDEESQLDYWKAMSQEEMKDVLSRINKEALKSVALPRALKAPALKP